MAKEITLPKLYQIPCNWRWVKMESILSTRCGFPFDSSRFSKDPNGRKPLIRIRDVVRGETETYTDELCPEEYVINCGDVLVGMDGDFNVAKWKSEKALLNQRVCFVTSSSEYLLNDYLFYYLPDPLKKINDATPSVTVKHLSTKTLEKTSIPIAPYPEQKRIVNRIESLFAKLDEAKEKAQAVVDGFEDRKAAILHKAFTGELTEEWRKNSACRLCSNVTKESPQIELGYDQPYPLPEGWRWAFIEEGFNVTSSKRVHKEDWLQEGIPFYRTRELVKLSDYGFVDNELFISPDLYEKCKRDYGVPQIGDLLISGVGTIGVPYVIQDDNPMYFKDGNVIWFQNKGLFDSKYVYYFYKSPFLYDQIHNMSAGTTVDTYTIINAKRTLIPVPSAEEQLKIVQCLDNLLLYERQAKEFAETLVNQIDEMKKSILAKAFRGELGTNDPSEEAIAI